MPGLKSSGQELQKKARMKKYKSNLVAKASSVDFDYDDKAAKHSERKEGFVAYHHNQNFINYIPYGANV